MTLTLSALLVSAVFGAEKESFTPTPSDYWIWGTKSESYQITKLDNGAKASITGQQDPANNPNTIQFRVVKQAGLPIGKYRLSFQGKSNRDITVPVSIMFEKKTMVGMLQGRNFIQSKCSTDSGIAIPDQRTYGGESPSNTVVQSGSSSAGNGV